MSVMMKLEKLMLFDFIMATQASHVCFSFYKVLDTFIAV